MKPSAYEPTITSRDNALVKTLYKLAHDSHAYRKTGQVWLEGEHLLCSYLGSNALDQEGNTARLVVGESYLARLAALLAPYPHAQQWPVSVISDQLLTAVSTLESPAPVGLLLALPSASSSTIQTQTAPVILDRLQDAGNAGSILRSAAALGFGQVLSIKGTVGLWSSKVLRAGMGAHFALVLHEGLDSNTLIPLLQAGDGVARLPILATSSHQGVYLHDATLPWPCAWVFGHEGQGVDHTWLKHASGHIRIYQVGQESLNVAAAAAICLHASGTQVRQP